MTCNRKGKRYIHSFGDGKACNHAPASVDDHGPWYWDIPKSVGHRTEVCSPLSGYIYIYIHIYRPSKRPIPIGPFKPYDSLWNC